MGHHRLHTETDAVNACLFVHSEQLLGHVVGVALNGDFGVVVNAKSLNDLCQ